MTQAVARQAITFTVNGRVFTVTTHPMKRLLDVLREDLGLTGTKEGCGEGECGSCTVIMDGLLVASCMIPICQAAGKMVTTIEGLAGQDALHAMQQAFCAEGGSQCGFCTPGMILAAAYYLENPGRARDVREALAGNQCRCTGYGRILKSVQTAQQKKGAEATEGNARLSS